MNYNTISFIAGKFSNCTFERIRSAFHYSQNDMNGPDCGISQEYDERYASRKYFNLSYHVGVGKKQQSTYPLTKHKLGY